MRTPALAVFVILFAAAATGIDCPPDATPENEPNCGLDEFGYPDDFVNGGCNGPVAHFTPIELGQTVCGTTAVNQSPGARDTDWYELTLTEPTYVIWRIEAEDRVFIGIVYNAGVPDCAEASCFFTHTTGAVVWISRLLEPGTWWLYIAPFFQDEYTCEFGYTATPIIRLPADINADGIVGSHELYWVLNDWGICPYKWCYADIDGDGVVGITDFLEVLGNWNE